MESCIICLESTSNSICDQCNCKAHPKCWNSYMNEKNVLELTVSEDNQMVGIIPLFVNCPMCRKHLTLCGTMRRSQTLDAREQALFLKIKEIIPTCREQPEKSIRELSSLFRANKLMIRKDKELMTTISSFLHTFANNHPEYYPIANQAHLYVFNNQLH